MDAPQRGFTRIGPVAVVVLPAEIDMGNAPRVGGELVAAALVRGISVVIADMSGTRFCDSSGVRVLLLAHRAATSNGIELRVVVSAESVRRVFELMGLDSVMPVFPSVDAALTAGPGRVNSPAQA